MNSKSEAFMTIGAAKGWAEVGQNHPHESAILHVLGEATYTDDIPEAQGTLTPRWARRPRPTHVSCRSTWTRCAPCRAWSTC